MFGTLLGMLLHLASLFVLHPEWGRGAAIHSSTAEGAWLWQHSYVNQLPSVDSNYTTSGAYTRFAIQEKTWPTTIHLLSSQASGTVQISWQKLYTANSILLGAQAEWTVQVCLWTIWGCSNKSRKDWWSPNSFQESPGSWYECFSFRLLQSMERPPVQSKVHCHTQRARRRCENGHSQCWWSTKV